MQLTIIGGGASILPQRERLRKALKGKFICGCNTAFMDFPTTFDVVQDAKLMIEFKREFERRKLILSCSYQFNALTVFNLNHLLLPCSKRLTANSYYISQLGLTGVFALSIAQRLPVDSVFLLGFDFDKSRWTERSEARADYNCANPSDIFVPFRRSNKNIFTVGETAIKSLYNLTYNDYYSRIKMADKSQDDLRNTIKALVF